MAQLDANAADAFSHFFLFGAASILQDASTQPIALHWESLQTATISGLESEVSLDVLATTVGAHAQKHGNGSWVTATASLRFGGKLMERSALSPRIGTPTTPDEWEELQRERHGLVDEADDGLDQRMIGSLGEPSYWATRRGEAWVDAGASDLELKTRNRGEDFVRNRLSKLALGPDWADHLDIRNRLAGSAVRDESGKGNEQGSRTPTGLRAPGPTDNVRAWCALWGLSAFPVRPTRGPSRTAAVHGSSQSATTLTLPLIGSPTTVARWRAVFQSAQLVAALSTGTNRAPAHIWLKRHGVRSLMTFRMHVNPNDNGPNELWLLDGERHPMES